jgi:hypothetical protein
MSDAEKQEKPLHASEASSEDIDVKWDGDVDGSQDAECPRSRSKLWKWTMTLLISNAALCVFVPNWEISLTTQYLYIVTVHIDI